MVFLRSLHIPLNTTLNRTGMGHKGPSPSASHQTSPEASKKIKALVSLLQGPPLCLTVAKSKPGQWDRSNTILADSFGTFIYLGKKKDKEGSAYKRPHMIVMP